MRSPKSYQKKLEATRAWRARKRADGTLSDVYRKQLYGLTPETYAELCRKFPSCGICGRADKPLCVDHDHTTQKVRGRLCVNCNTALGKFGDSQVVLNRAIEYLRSTS